MLTTKFPYFIGSAYGLCLCIYVPFFASTYMDMCVYLYVRHHHANKQASQQQKRQPKKHIVNICQIKAENPSKIFTNKKNPTHSERRMKFLLMLLFRGYFQWWGFLFCIIFIARRA